MRESSPPPQIETRALKRTGIIALAIALLIIAGGVTTRILARQEVKTWTREQSIPTVATIHPTVPDSKRPVSLPGSIEAWAQAPVYARTNGYLKDWSVDIGTPVKAGQVLATIDTPEVDQQVQAATANMATAEAQLKLAESTAARWDRMVAQDAVSKQEAEEKRGELEVRRAMASAVRAEMDRLRTLQNFRKIVAPFDGVVTSRSTDIGALIVSGNAARPLFTVADTKKMRIYVRVPQSYVGDIKPGLTATLSVPEYPGRVFDVKLLNTSEAVSDTTGTMLVQFVANNVDGALKPGAYASVDLAIPGAASAVRVPTSALLFRREGTMIALLDSNSHVKLKPITIAQDFGPEIEVATGLSANDTVVDSPPESLEEGDQVRMLQTSKQPGNAHD